MINVKTVEQFKIIEYLKKYFNLNEIKIYLINRTTIKIIDKENKIAYFKYDNKTNKVKFYEQEKER